MVLLPFAHKPSQYLVTTSELQYSFQFSCEESTCQVAAPLLYVVVVAAFVLNGYVLLCCRWLRRPVSANLALSLSLAGAAMWVAVLTGQIFF